METAGYGRRGDGAAGTSILPAPAAEATPFYAPARQCVGPFPRDSPRRKFWSCAGPIRAGFRTPRPKAVRAAPVRKRIGAAHRDTAALPDGRGSRRLRRRRSDNPGPLAGAVRVVLGRVAGASRRVRLTGDMGGRGRPAVGGESGVNMAGPPPEGVTCTNGPFRVAPPGGGRAPSSGFAQRLAGRPWPPARTRTGRRALPGNKTRTSPVSGAARPRPERGWKAHSGPTPATNAQERSGGTVTRPPARPPARFCDSGTARNSRG